MIKWQYLINRRKTWSRENTAFAAILSIILYDIGTCISIANHFRDINQNVDQSS